MLYPLSYEGLGVFYPAAGRASPGCGCEMVTSAARRVR